MDVKQIADKLEYLQVDIDMLADRSSSDFMYFSQWLSELDKKVKTFEATMLKFEKTQQFAEVAKAAAPAVQTVVQAQKLPKFKIALAIGIGVAVGIKMNEALNSPKEKK